MSKEKNLVKIKKPKNSNTIFGLPPKSYIDEDFWKKECETVLSNGWLFVGFSHELKKSGDVIPVFIANKPILLVRNGNEISAFHNVCSHRCLKLVNEKKNVGKIIRCPYHAWSYDLDGKLKAAPHVGGTNQHKPKGSNHGLKSIKVHIWYDWIFVNLNGKAKKFEEYAKPLIKKFDDIDLTKLKYATTLDFGKINTNWKFLIENFIEPYHVQFVHKATTNQPLKDHYTVVDGMCYGSGVDVDEEDTNNSAALSVTSKYLSLFPNFIIGTYFPNQIGVYLNIPVSPGITSQKRIIYTTDGKVMSKKEIKMVKNIWWSVHKEDHEMCERLQEGRYSPAAKEGGLLSPVWEKGVQAFQKLIVDATMKSSKSMKRKKNV
jgi:choline monooxygenase